MASQSDPPGLVVPTLNSDTIRLGGDQVGVISPVSSAQQPSVHPHISTIQRLQANRPHTASQLKSHFPALMVKNLKQKLRTPIATTVELLLPIVFVALLVVVWAFSSTKDHPAKQFIAADSEITDSSDEVASTICSGAPATPVEGFAACIGDTSGRSCLGKDEDLKIPDGAKLCFAGDSAMAEMIQEIGGEYAPSVIPTLHATLAARFAARAAWGPASPLGRLLFTPKDSAAVTELVGHLRTTTPLFDIFYAGTVASVAAVEDRVTAQDFNYATEAVIAVIDVQSADVSKQGAGVKVRIFMNESAVSAGDAIDPTQNGVGGGASTTWMGMAGGFASLQNTIQEFYQKRAMVAGGTAASVSVASVPAVVVAPMPTTAYKDNTFYATAATLSPLFLTFGYLFMVAQLTKRLVEEKESRMREAMMIMGLSNASFYGSWLLTYFAIVLVGALLVSALCVVTILKKSNFLLVFLSFGLFGLSAVTLATLFSAFFSKARMAAMVAPVLFFALSTPSFAIPATTSVGVFYGLSILSPVAFAQTMKLMFGFEQSTGTGFAQIGTDAKGYPLIVALFFLLVDIVLYLLLALYFDAIVPSDWGTRRHPLFCFAPCMRRCFGWGFGDEGSDGADVDPENIDGRDPNGEFESSAHPTAPAVEIRGLRKEFASPSGGRFVAVDDLRLDLHEGDVTVLLGHNGAGKTTAINVMTGMLGATRGVCRIYGHSIRDHLTAARQEIGFCPQHNILWDDLTCREHMHFFGRLKGYSGPALDEVADAMLNAVGLADKKNDYSAKLSGGQKRKLSVAVAFVGGSRMVFLDEPTAGMDVAARRFTWDLIKQMSPGRTIVLTTHFMDEADLLGNTVAIMAKGQLKCAGSPLFLKSRLGVGYNLSMACTPEADLRAIISEVRSVVPEAEEVSAAPGELTLRLPMESVAKFPALLRMLEDGSNGAAASKAIAQVRGHGLNATTLEEIFMRVGHDETAPVNRSRRGSLEKQPSGAQVEATAMHVGATGRKNYSPLWAAREAGQAAHGLTHLIVVQPVALFMKRLHNVKRDRRTQVLQIIVPVISILVALVPTMIKTKTTPPKQFDASLYAGISGYSGTETAVAMTANCPLEFTDNIFEHDKIDTVTLTPDPTAVRFSQHLLDTAKLHDPTRARAAAFICASQTAGGAGTGHAVIFSNETGMPQSMPFGLSTYRGMMTRAAVGDKALPWEMSGGALPQTAGQKQLLDQIRSLFVGIFILIPFTFIPSTFVTWIVKERQCKAKHLQLVCGMNYIVYWASNLVFDFACACVTSLLAMIIFLAFSRKEYVGDASTFFATLILFLLYCFASVTGSYLVSFMFDNYSTAQNVVMLANFLVGFMLVLVAYFMSMIKTTKKAGEGMTWAFRCWPAFCLGNGILNLAGDSIYRKGEWHMDVTGWNMVYMAIEGPLFLGLVLLIDHPSIGGRLRGCIGGQLPNSAVEPPVAEDDDVAEERRLVEGGAGQGDGDVITVRGLRKVYRSVVGSKVAVKNLSFRVRKGEVFGFLGTNGAGKTTTISMLCGEFPPTAGQMTIGGKDVVTEGLEVRRSVGYCPQFDACLELLTADEHLNLFAGLRGLTGDARTAAVECLIDAVGLQEHRDKVSSSLSGGNRRKLSVAISLLGAPEVVFLDEPSAGMDPMARRGLWDVLLAVAQHCSVVLTTHHLEEVEALAQRVGIMDQGELKCLGTLQHLKSKFGTGFEMAMRVSAEATGRSESVEQLAAQAEQFILGQIAGSRLQEGRAGKLTFALPQNTRLSAVFEIIEANRHRLAITDYGISQTTMESVFLKISEEVDAADL